MLDLSHKKLIAWQKAIALLPLLYKVCQKLPPEKKTIWWVRSKEQVFPYPTIWRKALREEASRRKFDSLRSHVPQP